MTERAIHYRLLTLGRIALVRAGEEEAVLADAKPLAVLAVLAAEGPQRPDQVTELLWPDAPRDRAAASLRQALYSVSQAAGRPLVERTDALLTLTTAGLSVDLVEFRAAMEEGAYERAIEVHAGHFLGGYEAVQDRRFVQWAEEVDDRVELQLQQAYDLAVESALRARELDRAVALAEEFRTRFPLVTHAVDCLVIALRSAGRLREAIAEIQLFGQRLRQELDEPLPADLAAFREVLEEELRHGLNELGEEAAELGPAEGVVVASGAGAGGRQGDGSRPRRGDGSRPRRARRWRRVLGGGGVIVGSAALLVAVGFVALSGGSGAAELEIPARIGGEQAWAILGEDGVRIEAVEGLPRRSVRSVTGVLARNVVTPAGIDIELEYPDGRRATILDTRADEVPLDWSPDGRYLLYHHVLASSRFPGYRARMGVWDSETGSGRILYEAPDANIGSAATWCPGGGRVAVVEERREGPSVVVIDLDGNVLSRIGGNDLSADQPAWSPDGERLAFTGTRDGEVDIHVARWDGSGLRRLGNAPSSERTPVWLSDRHVAAVTDGPQSRLVILGTEGTEALSLSANGVTSLAAPRMRWPPDATDRVSRLIEHLERGPAAALPAVWLESVRIEGNTVVSPGEYAGYRLVGKDPRGRSSAMLPPAVRWAAGDSSVLRPLEGGRYRALRTGTTRVHADLPGWAGDPLTVTVREPEVLRVPALFTEAWTGGLDPARWSPYGEPLPNVDPTGGPDGDGAFDSRGDANLNSGAVSLRSFDLGEGLTVELWGRMVPTGAAYQGLHVELVAGDPTARNLRGLPDVHAVAGIRMDGSRGTVSFWGKPSSEVPLPDGIGEWQRYALQLHPDGTVAFLVNGSVHCRISDPVPLDRPVHVHLGGRSLTTTVLHGPVTVYGGVRYAIE